MENNLELLEEFDIARELQTPHLLHKKIYLSAKKQTAYSILSRKQDEILLANSTAFNTDSVFTGLSEKHIEFIAQHAPADYRKEIIDLIFQDYKLDNIFEIAKAMDQDLGGNTTQNQTRVKNVIQYIKDNRIAFEF